MEGKVTWFNAAKGYGEIVTSENEAYMFTYDEIQTKDEFKKIERNALVKFRPTAEKTFNLPTAKKVQQR